MSTTTTTPAVYVGTYYKYNCGSIFGKWFDLTEFEGQDDFYEACQARAGGGQGCRLCRLGRAYRRL